jgi:adenylate kinase family enzyme
MRAALSERTIIIGNGGAGKSTLAAALGAALRLPVIELDLLHWENDGAGAKRDEAVAAALAREAASGARWIMEGVYGWLAAAVMPRATALLWLDVPWEVCRAGLIARGPRRGASAQDQAELLAWAEAYWQRQTSSSFAGHARLFDRFTGAKQRLTSRAAVEAFAGSAHLPLKRGGDP